MADIDTSTYPKPKNSNPLEMVSGFANLQNTLNQNKLFQQQFQTNKAVSDIYKRAVKPDGTVDMNLIRDEVSKNPDAAYGLEQVFKGAQGLQQGQIATNSAQVDLARKNIETFGSYFTPFENKVDKDGKPNASVSDVMTAAAKAITAGHVDPKVVTQFLADMPSDDSQIPAWIKQKHLQFLDTQSRFNAMHPAPTMQPLPGGGVAPFVMPQSGQVQQVGPTIPGAPSPTTQYVDPSGTPRYFGNQAANPYAPGGAQSGQQGQPGMAPGGNIAGIPAGMSPAAQAASQKSGGDSADQMAALRSEVGGSANRILQLQNASTALEGAWTGKGSQKIQDLRSLLVTTGFVTPALADKVKNFDEAKKYMLASMLSRGAGLGINTNEKLAALSGASANTDISQLAAKDIIRTTIGLEKAQQAQYAAFQKTGLPAEQFADWATNWNGSRDLRAYPLMQKPAAERVKFIEALKPAEKARIIDTLREGISLGKLSPSDFPK